MKNTILIDFDGVIRHWSDTEVKNMLFELELEDDVLFSCAFSDKHLLPAITGKITHDKWCELVELELSQTYGDQISKQLVTAWYNASSDIDFEFLTKIRNSAPNASLVLVTNATTRLDSDLAKQGLKNEFDLVVNSSVIGVSKPEREFFETTIQLLGKTVKDCIFIDDSLTNVISARELGIESIHHKEVSETLNFISQST